MGAQVLPVDLLEERNRTLVEEASEGKRGKAGAVMRCDHFHGFQSSPQFCKLLNDEERKRAEVFPGRCPLWTSKTKIGQRCAPRCPRALTMWIRAVYQLFSR